MDRRWAIIGGIAGGTIGYIVGLFFKSLVPLLILLKFPSFEEYLVSTFIPAAGLSTPDFIRFFTVPLPFALMGGAIGVLIFRSGKGAKTVSIPET